MRGERERLEGKVGREDGHAESKAGTRTFCLLELVCLEVWIIAFVKTLLFTATPMCVALLVHLPVSACASAPSVLKRLKVWRKKV